MLRDKPIQQKLTAVIMLTTGLVLLLACALLIASEVITFRRSMAQNLATQAELIAAQSSAALAFQNADDAAEVLAALRMQRHIVAAALYTHEGVLFACHPETVSPSALPARPGRDGHRFEHAYLHSFQPVTQGGSRLGTLYLQSDMQALRERLQLYAGIIGLVILVSALVAYLLSRVLQRQVAEPILALARTTRRISERQDYSVRAQKVAADEVGEMTDAFNQMLEQIQTLTSDLESRVQQRTAELARVNTQLEQSNRELESFSYSVSHDLRAPLRHIEGYVELLTRHLGGALDEKSRRYLKTVKDTVTEMAALIDDLLAFSRMSRVELQREAVPLDRLVTETIAGLERETQGRNIVWQRTPLPVVQGDPGLLKQVFVNLISNALKYSRPRDPARIEIGCTTGAVPGESVFFVRDNGVGFDMSYAGKLFGVFQRLHHADEFEGTGIGLANVRRIVSRHGGRIWAEAAPDEGATFHFTIPPQSEST